MRIPRLYLSHPLIIDSEIELEQSIARHVVQVLRLKPGHPIILFNGQGGEYKAELVVAEKRKAIAKIIEFNPIERESTLDLHLAIGISKGDRMDYAIQKAVEAGTNQFTPLITEHCAFSINKEKIPKRLAHWQNVIHSACEQSGRNKIPQLNSVTNFKNFCDENQQGLRLVLAPMAEKTLTSIQTLNPSACTLCVGPEGGLSQLEIEQASQCGFDVIRIGERILRTETAAIVSVTALQILWGDLK